MSVRPALGGQRHSLSKTVSKVPKILPGSREENVGQRSVGTCGREVKVKEVIVLGSIPQGLAGGRAVLGVRVSLASYQGSFARRLFRLR